MLIKKLIPTSIKDNIKHKLRVWLDKDLPKVYCCNACSNYHSGFLAFDISIYLEKNFIFSISDFETFNISNYFCPICHSSDRDRLYIKFWQGELCLIKPEHKRKLLDFAPTETLSSIFKKNLNIEYRTADLYMEGVDDKVDIQAMELYNDDSFDYIHCSHVLEHVTDDKLAAKELFRILKPTGKAVLMVPILKTMKGTYEAAEITNPDERWKHFGQNDHLRIYSKESFVKLLSDAGFTVEQIPGRQLFNTQPYINGIDPDSILYVVTK